MLLPTAPLVASLMGFLRVQEENRRVTGVGVSSTIVLFVLGLQALSLSSAGILGESSAWRILNRIVLSFSGASFNMLIHQNVHIVGSEVIFRLVSFLKNGIKHVAEEGPGFRLFCPRKVWNVCTICS